MYDKDGPTTPPLNKDAVTPKVLQGAPILSLIWKLDDIRILPLVSIFTLVLLFRLPVPCTLRISIYNRS